MKKTLRLAVFVLLTTALLLFAGCDALTGALQQLEQNQVSGETGIVTGKVAFANSTGDLSRVKVTLVPVDSGVYSTELCAVPEFKDILPTSAARTARTATTTSAYASVNGSYTFSNVEPGNYTIYASLQDSLEKAVATNIEVRASATVNAELLSLTATGSIVGTVTLDGTATGNEGFLVLVSGTGYFSSTDEEGNFNIPYVPAGKNYSLLILRGLYIVPWKNIQVTAGSSVLAGSKNIQSSDIQTDNNAFIWKGSYENQAASALKSPSAGWAFYNTTDGCSYIYTGKEWTLFARAGTNGQNGTNGTNGINGNNGTNGTNGSDGMGIKWLGSFDSASEITEAKELDAFYNITDGCSYIYIGNSWTLLAKAGKDGTNGTNGSNTSNEIGFVTVYAAATPRGVSFDASFLFPASYYDIYINNEESGIGIHSWFDNKNRFYTEYPFTEAGKTYTFKVEVWKENYLVYSGNLSVTATGGIGEVKLENKEELGIQLSSDKKTVSLIGTPVFSSAIPNVHYDGAVEFDIFNADTGDWIDFCSGEWGDWLEESKESLFNSINLNLKGFNYKIEASMPLTVDGYNSDVWLGIRLAEVTGAWGGEKAKVLVLTGLVDDENPIEDLPGEKLTVTSTTEGSESETQEWYGYIVDFGETIYQPVCLPFKSEDNKFLYWIGNHEEMLEFPFKAYGEKIPNIEIMCNGTVIDCIQQMLPAFEKDGKPNPVPDPDPNYPVPSSYSELAFFDFNESNWGQDSCAPFGDLADVEEVSGKGINNSGCIKVTQRGTWGELMFSLKDVYSKGKDYYIEAWVKDAGTPDTVSGGDCAASLGSTIVDNDILSLCEQHNATWDYYDSDWDKNQPSPWDASFSSNVSCYESILKSLLPDDEDEVSLDSSNVYVTDDSWTKVSGILYADDINYIVNAKTKDDLEELYVCLYLGMYPKQEGYIYYVDNIRILELTPGNSYTVPDPEPQPDETRLSIYAAKGDPVLPSGTKQVMPSWDVDSAGIQGLPDFITALNGLNSEGSIVQTNTKTTDITNVTPELKAALKTAQETPGFFASTPKNVIFIISDGMGESHVKMSREYKGELICDSINIHRSMDTRSFKKGDSEANLSDKATLITTDHCAGGTALLSGYKTRYGYIGLDLEANQVETLAELAKRTGRKVGCVTNDCTTDATPAATLCHSSVRSSYTCLNIQQALFGADVVIGGYTEIDTYAKSGVNFLSKIASYSSTEKAWDMAAKMTQSINVAAWWEQYKSGEYGNIFAEKVFGDASFFADKDEAWFEDYFASQNYYYATTITGMLTAAYDPYVKPIMYVDQAAPDWESNYVMGFLLKSSKYPSFPEMVAYTLSMLRSQDIADNDTDGFFCMIENTNTDAWGHLDINTIKDTGSPAADGGAKIQGENIKAAFIANEVQNTDEGVAIAVKFVLEHPDTLLVVAGGNETGGLSFESGWESDYSKIWSSTTGHSSAMAPLWVLGAGAELFTKDLKGNYIEDISIEEIMSTNNIEYPSYTDYINYYTGAKIGELMGDPNFGCRQNGDPRYGGYAD